MTGSGKSCNGFWQVGSSATLGTGTSFVGNILEYSSISLTRGARLSGRALARSGAVTMDANVVSLAGCPGGKSRGHDKGHDKDNNREHDKDHDKGHH